jgi:hypothetical protein
MAGKTFEEQTSKNPPKPTVQAVSVAPIFEPGKGRGNAEEAVGQLYNAPDTEPTQPIGRPFFQRDEGAFAPAPKKNVKDRVKCEESQRVEFEEQVVQEQLELQPAVQAPFGRGRGRGNVQIPTTVNIQLGMDLNVPVQRQNSHSAKGRGRGRPFRTWE